MNATKDFVRERSAVMFDSCGSFAEPNKPINFDLRIENCINKKNRKILAHYHIESHSSFTFSEIHGAIFVYNVVTIQVSHPARKIITHLFDVILRVSPLISETYF